MGDCIERSISHSEMNSNRTSAIFTIGHAEKSRETPPEREMANSVTKTVKFNSQNDIKQLTTEEARKELIISQYVHSDWNFMHTGNTIIFIMTKSTFPLNKWNGNSDYGTHVFMVHSL